MKENSYTRKPGFKSWARRYLSISFFAAVAVLSYLLFFTDNSVAASYEQTLRNDSIRAEIRAEKDSLHYYQRMNTLLTTDRGTLEQVVRERFHMQRPGEDVYLTD